MRYAPISSRRVLRGESRRRHLRQVSTALSGYELLEPAGRGTHCHIYRARERATGRFRAVKLLRPSRAQHPEARSLLEQEAAVANKVDHPNLITVHGAHLEGRRPFLVLEWLDGAPLRELLDRHGKLEPIKALAIARQLASALAALERQGFVHGDLKPANVFCCSDGAVRLIDLGFAQKTGVQSAGQRRIAGTARYLAPERISSLRGLTVHGDVYSLGVVLYEMLAGRHPFPPGDVSATVRHHRQSRPYPLRKLVQQVPRCVADFVGQLLAKEPLRRPTPAEAVTRLLCLEVDAFERLAARASDTP